MLAGAGGFVGYWSLYPVPDSFGLLTSGQSTQILVGLSGFIATLVGVLLGSAYRRLSAMKAAGRKNIGKLRTFLKSLLESVDLWMGFVASPLVFALLLRASEGMSTPGLLIVGLENGFCCLLIAESLIPSAAE